MLKIKDNVDLKELEKFGFKNYKYRYGRDIDNQWLIIIDIKTRKIKNWNFLYGNYRKDIELYIKDLIQAGLIEKVVDDER